MAKFKFHGSLKQHVPNGELLVDGNRTVVESLTAITDAHESLKRVLYSDGTRKLHDYFRILVNEEMVEFLDEGMNTRLKTEDVVSILPPVSGG
ncbi:MAG: MoaD/ThiS family protein [Chloroflexi bacterium]|nr:MoaD/ThiS family protein [Chloroflexota bacterium]